MIYKEDYKININSRTRLLLLILSSFLICLIIVSVIYWGATSKNKNIINYLISSKKFTYSELKKDPNLIDGFIRARSLSIIITSSIFLCFFGWLVLRGKKVKYGNAFSFFWIFLFFGNGFAVFWYSFQKIDVFIIIQSINNFSVCLILILFSIEVYKHKQKIRRKNFNNQRKNYGI